MEQDHANREAFKMNPLELLEIWMDQRNTYVSYQIYKIFGHQTVKYKESIRIRFLDYLNLKLNIKNSEDLIKYCILINSKSIKPESAFIDVFDTEFVLSEFFQFKILNFTPDYILSNRFKFSFKNYMLHENGYYDKEYVGTVTKYYRWFLNI